MRELILTSLQASNRLSGNAEPQHANWKLPMWRGWLTAWICLEAIGLEGNIMHSACCVPASRRDERDILDHAKLVCTCSQPLQTLSLKALCKCMRECLTQVLTRMFDRFTESRLISLRASFKYKLWALGLRTPIFGMCRQTKVKPFFWEESNSLIFVRVETKLLPLSHFGGPWGSRCSCTLYLVTDPDWALFRKNLTGLLIGDLAGSFCLVWVGCHLCCLQAANPMGGCGPHSCFIGAIVRE